jgi:hypothetical protein
MAPNAAVQQPRTAVELLFASEIESFAQDVYWTILPTLGNQQQQLADFGLRSALSNGVPDAFPS